MIAAHPFGQSFGELFDLAPAGEGAFTLRIPSAWGGATLAAAALAACRATPDKAMRSLHAWFLRPVVSNTDVVVRVEAIRDGRLLSHRRVTLETDGKLLVELTASFGAAEAPAAGAIAWQEPEAAPPSAPDATPSLFDLRPAEETWRDVLDWRPIGPAHQYREADPSSAWDSWVAPTMALPEGVGWDAAALAYLSDNHSDWSMAQRVKGYTIQRYSTLDTQVWFHRAPRWDDWLFIRSVSEVAHAGFALGRRELYDREGVLVASMAQEALYR